MKNILKVDEPKTGTATGKGANAGLIESCDISVTPGLTPYKMQGKVLELTEFAKKKKSAQIEANVNCNSSNKKSTQRRDGTILMM